MKRLNILAVLCGLVLLALAVVPKVKADEHDKKTTLTFTEPFEVPGTDPQVLPAGTYVFKLFDSLSDRNIVQIFSADETHVFTTILAINNYRLRATDKTVLTFGERGAGTPEAIKAWFYPGDNFGQEFVYPKRRALELAKIVNEPVLAVPVETNTVPINALRTLRLEAIKPTGEEAPVAVVVQSSPQVAATAAVKSPSTALVAENLPQTASSMPLFALIGLVSLFVGFALLIVTRRAA